MADEGDDPPLPRYVTSCDEGSGGGSPRSRAVQRWSTEGGSSSSPARPTVAAASAVEHPSREDGGCCGEGQGASSCGGAAAEGEPS